MKLQNGNTIHADIGDYNASKTPQYSWASITADAPFTYVVGHWYHIAYVVSFVNIAHSPVYEIYANDSLVGSGSLTGASQLPLFDANHPTGYIGSNIGSGNNEYFNGDIDELRIYNQSLTQSQILEDATGASNSVTQHVAYYNFDAITSNTVADQWAHNYTCTLAGSPTVAQSYAMGLLTANWLAPANVTVTNYLVDVAKDNAFNNPVVTGKSVTAGTTSVFITRLTQNTQYYYRVTPNNTATAVAGQGTYSNTVAFTTPTLPTITSFSPASGGSGTAVTITSTNFTNATTVSFGGTAAASVAFNSSTSITAVVGSGTTGAIAVATQAGTATSSTNFAYFLTAAIPAFSPASAGYGAAITITGTNFTGVTAVSFGGTAAASFTVNSTTSITAYVASGASGVIK